MFVGASEDLFSWVCGLAVVGGGVIRRLFGVCGGVTLLVFGPEVLLEGDGSLGVLVLSAGIISELKVFCVDPHPATMRHPLARKLTTSVATGGRELCSHFKKCLMPLIR